MGPRQDKPDAKAKGPGWLGFSKFLLLMLLGVFAFWLGHSMVQHHFFRGGAQDYRLSSGR
jgi:hypothetical protein